MSPQVMVNIGGRSFRLACNPGEEQHLIDLAKFIDGKIAQMHGSFKDMGDQRIVVMAALAVADELFEARRKLEDADDATAQAVGREAKARGAAEARTALVEAALMETTSRVEALVDLLNGGAAEDD
jgi:cell division protein ZapA